MNIQQLQICALAAVCAVGSINTIDLKPTKGTSFEAIAGDIPESVKIVLKYLDNKKKFIELGAEPYKGILFYGPPGTGKTALARALAGEAKVPFFVVRTSEIISKYYGETEKNIREVFETARFYASQDPKQMAILFFDEIDYLGAQRTGGEQDIHRAGFLNTLLEEMDGFDSTRTVMVIGSTNRIEALDPAIIRPGRLDTHIFIGLPGEAARKAILNLYLSKVKYEYAHNAVQHEAIMQHMLAISNGFSAAEIEYVVNEAARRSAFHDLNFVSAALILLVAQDLSEKKRLYSSVLIYNLYIKPYSKK